MILADTSLETGRHYTQHSSAHFFLDHLSFLAPFSGLEKNL